MLAADVAAAMTHRMTRGERALVLAALAFAVLTFVTAGLMLAGYDGSTRACEYLVPSANVPAVYVCSSKDPR